MLLTFSLLILFSFNDTFIEFIEILSILTRNSPHIYISEEEDCQQFINCEKQLELKPEYL